MRTTSKLQICTRFVVHQIYDIYQLCFASVELVKKSISLSRLFSKNMLLSRVRVVILNDSNEINLVQID